MLLLPCEVTVRSLLPVTKCTLPNTESAGTLVLDLPASEAVRTRLMLFISYPVSSILL